jgi:hypothetical protein
LRDGVNILGTLQPVGRSLGIELLVIVSFKRQPATLGFFRVSELDSLFKYNKFELIRTEGEQQL